MKSAFYKMGLFVMLLVILVASGCAPAPAPAPEKVVETVVQVQTVVVQQPGQNVVVTATPVPAAPEKPLRIALIFPSSIKDMAFSQSMYEAVMALQKEMGADKLEIKYSENMFKVPDAAAAIRDYATQGFDIVIAHGSQYGSSIQQVAPDFPKVSFAHGTTANTFNSDGITNVFAYEARTQDAGYVVGLEMAMLTKSKQLGWCGPVNSGDHGLFFKGMKAGVASVAKDIKINEVWTNNYSDVSLMAACAEQTIKSGADVLTGGSQSFVGSIGVAKDKNTLTFGSQWNQTSLAPNILVASYTYDWKGVVKDIIASHKAGVMGGKIYTATFQNGGMLMEYNDAYKLDPAIKAAGDQAMADLKAGKIKIDLTAK